MLPFAGYERIEAMKIGRGRSHLSVWKVTNPTIALNGAKAQYA
jgi:hypothetical protein